MGLRIAVVRLNDSPDSLLAMTLKALRRARDHLRNSNASPLLQHQTCLNVLRYLILTVCEVADAVCDCHAAGPYSSRESPEIFAVRYFFGTNAAVYIEQLFNAKVSALLGSPSAMDNNVLSKYLETSRTIVFIDEVISRLLCFSWVVSC